MSIATLASISGSEAATKIAKGCTSKSYTQKYKIGPVTAYGINYSVRWCWTKGTTATSKNNTITGGAYPWANPPYDWQHGIGPANKDRVPISSSWKDSNGSTMVYFYFQSRACVTGKLGIGCDKWKWHKLKHELKAGGGISLISAS